MVSGLWLNPSQPAIPRSVSVRRSRSGGAAHVTLSDPRVEQTGLRRYYLVPSSTTRRGRRGPALGRACAIDGRRPHSYLYRALVIDRSLATSTGRRISGQPRSIRRSSSITVSPSRA